MAKQKTTPIQTVNPYRFKVTQGTLNSVSSAYELVTFNTVVFDPNNNFSTANKRYTIPVSGYYLFSGDVSYAGGAAVGRTGSVLYTNAALTHWGDFAYSAASQTSRRPFMVYDYFTAGQTVEIHGFCDSTQNTEVDANRTWFTGFLVHV